MHPRASCGRAEETKKASEGTTSPLCQPHPPFATATVFCMWSWTVDVIKLAKFQVFNMTACLCVTQLQSLMYQVNKEGLKMTLLH